MGPYRDRFDQWSTCTTGSARCWMVMAAAVLDSRERIDQVIAGLLVSLDAPSQAAMVWLAETGEADHLARVAALLDHART